MFDLSRRMAAWREGLLERQTCEDADLDELESHLREEVDFGGNMVVQAGWAWRRVPRGALFRIGLEYFTGKSDQYEFFDRTEHRLGWGIWADF